MDSCVKTVKKQYRVGALRAMTYKGHVYGLPEFTNQITLIINQSAFKGAGVPIAPRRRRTGRRSSRREEADEVRLEREPRRGSGSTRRSRGSSRCGSSGSARTCVSKNGLKAQLNTPQAIPALTFAKSAHQRGGRLEQVQGIPRHVRLLRRGEPARQGPARVLADGELHLQRRSRTTRRTSTSSASSSRTARAARSRCSAATAGPSRRARGTRRRVRVHEGGDVGRRVDHGGEEALRRAQGARGSTFTGVYTANAVADKKIYEDIYQSFGQARSSTTRCGLLVAAPKYGFELPPVPGRPAVRPGRHGRDQPRAHGPADAEGGAEPGAEGSADRDQREQVATPVALGERRRNDTHHGAGPLAGPALAVRVPRARDLGRLSLHPRRGCSASSSSRWGRCSSASTTRSRTTGSQQIAGLEPTKSVGLKNYQQLLDDPKVDGVAQEHLHLHGDDGAGDDHRRPRARDDPDAHRQAASSPASSARSSTSRT